MDLPFLPLFASPKSLPITSARGHCGVAERVMDMESRENWVQTLPQALASYVAMGKLLNLSESQFPSLEIMYPT